MGRRDEIKAEVVETATPTPTPKRKSTKKEDPRVLKTRRWVGRIAALLDELKAETVDKGKRDKLDLIAEYVSLIVEENELIKL